MRSTLLSRARGESAAALAAASFAMGWRQALAAWPVMLGRCLFFVLVMIVLAALWDKVAAERLAGTLAQTLPPGGLAIYVGVTEWITLSVVAVHLRLEDDIRSGALEPHLTRPRSYLPQRIYEAFGGMAARLVFLGATGLCLLALSGRAGPDAPTFAVIAVLGALGAAIGVLLYALVGLCAFWVRRVLPALLIMQKLMFLAGGLFAPITLYPDWLYRLCAPTPFAAHVFFPGQMAIAPSLALAAHALVLQLAWLGLLALACALVWSAGLTRLLREGG